MPHPILRLNLRKGAKATAAVIALMLVPAGACLADSLHSDNLPRVTIKYGDLNLSTTEGAKRLLRRIEAGARQVCGDTYTKDLARWTSIRRCYSQAVANAVQDVKAQRVIEAYRAAHSMASAN